MHTLLYKKSQKILLMYCCLICLRTCNYLLQSKCPLFDVDHVATRSVTSKLLTATVSPLFYLVLNIRLNNYTVYKLPENSTEPLCNSPWPWIMDNSSRCRVVKSKKTKYTKLCFRICQTAQKYA